MSMQTSLERLSVAERLHDAGQHARLIEYLRSEPVDEITRSPTLALLFGISYARLGHYGPAEALAAGALDRARAAADARIEARALNALGAIAFQCGRIPEAESRFAEGMDAAHELHDPLAIGRCANNLGVIANLHGDFPRAMASFTRALAAFEQARTIRGVAETLNNMAISFRDQRDYARAVDCGERAIAAAGDCGDRGLFAHALAGRAETRLRSGDARVARREAEAAVSIHRELTDVVGESEAQRIVALTLIENGDFAGGESGLQAVAAVASQHGRLLLVAAARRDLANLYYELRRWEEMREVARSAREFFAGLGATREVENLDELLGAGPV